MRLPYFWKSHLISKKIGFYFVKGLGGWSLRVCLWSRAFCFGIQSQRVPKSFMATLPEQGEGARTVIVGE